MDVKLFILFTFLKCQCTYSITTSISGEISDDITFFHKTFPVPPSIRAIIEVDVYHHESMRRTYPILGIYTTDYHINLRKQCTDTMYGQLGNKYLHSGITTYTGDSGCLKCKEDSTNILHCTGNITIQDFIPRKFSFSFGFFCDSIKALSSLKGLVYNISIEDQGNETKCFQFPRNHSCYRYIQHQVYPSLMGPTGVNFGLQL